MTTLTAQQLAFLAMHSDAERAPLQSALEKGDFLYAVVVPCMNGQMSTGSMSLDDATVPSLGLREAMAADLASEQAEYAKQIADDERDDDDEFEGELMAVRWNSDDTLTFFADGFTADEQALATQTLSEVCGL